MWRARVLTVVATALLASSVTASIFSEGGPVSGNDAVDYDSLLNGELKKQLDEAYEREMAREEAEMADQDLYERQLAEILTQMSQQQQEEEGEQEQGGNDQGLEVSEVFGPESEHQDSLVKAEPSAVKEPEQKEEAVEQKPIEEEKPVEKPQKKGQSEYVSFVEPEAVAYRHRDVQSFEKRRLAQSIHGNSYSPRGDSNLAMMAVGCVLVVGVVGGAIGGLAYRKRKESPDDSEYAPYAGIGPFRRGKKDNKGDDALAYKAQLHHYHQAKQKIICGDDAPEVGLESDEEECPDDENNYSVYECPGLAPTGDIEVHNPNFAAQH